MSLKSSMTSVLHLLQNLIDTIDCKASKAKKQSLSTISYDKQSDIELYSEVYDANKWFYKSLVYTLLQYLPSPATNTEKSVIDLACGFGIFCQELAHKGGYKTVVGIDIAKEMITEAYRLLSLKNLLLQRKISFKVGDCCYMDEEFIRNSRSVYDAVVCQFFYPFANNTQQLSQMIANVHMLLKPGGVHVVCTLNPFLVADTMTDVYSDQWKEFGKETKANAAMINSGRAQYKVDGEISLGLVTTLKVDEQQLHMRPRVIDVNCTKYKLRFYAMATYNSLFIKNGFCNIRWLTGNEYFADPSLAKMQQQKFLRYVRNNPSFAVLMMYKNV